MEEEFEAALQAAFGNLTSFGAFGGFTPPTSYEDVLQLTVGDYLDLLDLAEQALVDNRPIIQAQLNNPQFTANLPSEALSFFQSWAAGNTDFITEGFDLIRDELSGIPTSTLLVNVAPGSGGTGGGGGVTVTQEIEDAFADAVSRFTGFDWFNLDGLALSPTFRVDEDTGSWFSLGSEVPAFSGADLASLYALIGEAAGSAIIAHFNAQTALIQQLVNDGATAVDFAAAEAAVEAAAGTALQNLQGYGETLFNAANPNYLQIEASAYAEYLAVINAVTSELPSLASDLSALMFGSRNSDPTFVVDVDGALDGTDEGDWVHLNDLANTFDGGVGQDIVLAYDGNDTLTGGADDDILMGGDGNGDTAVYSGLQSGYTARISADGTVEIEDRTADRDGTDILTGIETLQFGESTTFNLGKQVGIASLSEEEIASFVELYIAYFNRAPDAIGLNFWGSAFANGVSLEEIASQFLNQPETQATYPDGLSNLEFATQVYGNVLGRTPDGGGLTFWVNALDSGGVTRDTFILNVLEGAKVDLPDGSSQEDIDLQIGDRAYLAEKTEVGEYFAIINGLSNVEEATAVMDLFIRDGATSQSDAFTATDEALASALSNDGAEFLIQLVGVIEDPTGPDLAV